MRSIMEWDGGSTTIVPGKKEKHFTHLVFRAASTTPRARNVLSAIWAHVEEGNRVNDITATDSHTNQRHGLWIRILPGATVSTPWPNLNLN